MFLLVVKKYENQLLRLVPGNAKLVGRTCQQWNIQNKCPVVQFRVFPNDPPISRIEVLIKNFAIAEQPSVALLPETFPASENFRSEKASRCKVFQFFLRILSLVHLNYLLHFVHQGLNRHFSTNIKLFDC